MTDHEIKEGEAYFLKEYCELKAVNTVLVIINITEVKALCNLLYQFLQSLQLNLCSQSQYC
jgi:hypothetical protein